MPFGCSTFRRDRLSGAFNLRRIVPGLETLRIDVTPPGAAPTVADRLIWSSAGRAEQSSRTLSACVGWRDDVSPSRRSPVPPSPEFLPGRPTLPQPRHSSAQTAYLRVPTCNCVPRHRRVRWLDAVGYRPFASLLSARWVTRMTSHGFDRGRRRLTNSPKLTGAER